MVRAASLGCAFQQAQGRPSEVPTDVRKVPGKPCMKCRAGRVSVLKPRPPFHAALAQRGTTQRLRRRMERLDFLVKTDFRNFMAGCACRKRRLERRLAREQRRQSRIDKARAFTAFMHGGGGIKMGADTFALPLHLLRLVQGFL